MTDWFSSIPAETLDALLRFLGSLTLLGLIIAISYWKHVGMEKSFLVATLRGFGQLLILASLLAFIFQLDGILPLFGILTLMIFFGAKTAADRLEQLDGVFRIELIALLVSVYTVMISMSLLRVLPTDDPAFWIPIGGMVTGNSMNISYLALNKIQNDIKQRKSEIDAALALGATPAMVVDRLGIISTALKTAITPNTNNLRTLGLVFIPGLMTGLLIGGLNPIAAAFLQVMIFFLILGGGMLTALIGSTMIPQLLFDMENLSISQKYQSMME